MKLSIVCDVISGMHSLVVTWIVLSDRATLKMAAIAPVDRKNSNVVVNCRTTLDQGMQYDMTFAAASDPPTAAAGVRY